MQIPTDGLVLRGWYTTITLAVYGALTKVLTETVVASQAPAPSSVPPPSTAEVGPAARSPGRPEWGSQPVEVTPDRAYVADSQEHYPGSFPPETSYPQQEYPPSYPDQWNSAQVRNCYLDFWREFLFIENSQIGLTGSISLT